MRRKAIRPNPERVREWQQRSREKAQQRPRKPSSGFRRKARVPAAVRQRVFARSAGRCVRPGCERKAAHIHHWLDEAKFPHLALIEDNMSGTCAQCNWAHHFAPDQRLPRSAIPACALRLAEQAGRGARAHLQRYYPTQRPRPAADT